MRAVVNVWHSRAAILVAGTVLLAGCKPDAALRQSENLDKRSSTATSAGPAGPAVDASQLGSVQGVVDFVGAAPKPVKIDMSMDPVCEMKAATNMSEQIVVNGGKVANVYVFVKSGAAPSKAPAGQKPVVLDQQGCRYLPHVIAVQQGGSVEFRNSDPTMHNVHTMPEANAGIDVSMAPMGQPQVKQFTTPEVMMPVRCNNHPWMSAFINVAETPYFAVTGADGKFTIQGLPPGTYTLAAVQEKLGEQDMQVTVPATGTAKAEFKFGAK